MNTKDVVDARVEIITPQTAEKYLATMTSNRHLNQRRTVEYAVLMDEDRWVLNGETLKFDKHGHLFDGQHRLQACLLSEKPFPTYVLRGVEDDRAFATIDIGGSRTPGDVFHLAGFSNSISTAAVARILYWHQHKMMALSGPRMGRGASGMNARIKKMTKGKKGIVHDIKIRVPDKEELVAFARPLAESIVEALNFVKRLHIDNILMVNTAAACYLIFAEKSKDEAAQFLVDLAAGAELSTDDPVHVLREKLISTTKRHVRLAAMAVILLVFKTWNKRRNRERVKFLKIVEGEEFPKVL